MLKKSKRAVKMAFFELAFFSPATTCPLQQESSMGGGMAGEATEKERG